MLLRLYRTLDLKGAPAPGEKFTEPEAAISLSASAIDQLPPLAGRYAKNSITGNADGCATYEIPNWASLIV